jgi:hypothetical protein
VAFRKLVRQKQHPESRAIALGYRAVQKGCTLRFLSAAALVRIPGDPQRQGVTAATLDRVLRYSKVASINGEIFRLEDNPGPALLAAPARRTKYRTERSGGDPRRALPRLPAPRNHWTSISFFNRLARSPRSLKP